MDSKAEIKWDYRGDIREYFNESKIVSRCLWRLRTKFGVSQRFCQWEKFILTYRKTHKKDLK